MIVLAGAILSGIIMSTMAYFEIRAMRKKTDLPESKSRPLN